MNLKDLSKEQKQYLILGVVGAVVVLGAIVFGVKFSLSSIGVARVELQDLTDKIERADRSLSKNQRNETALFETISKLKAYLEKIPPDQNYYSWATEVIYGTARTAHLEIDAINESGMGNPRRNAKGKSAVSVESYSLRIIAHGRYENIKRFLLEMSRKHPMVRITGLEISTGSLPEIHDVQLLIQWPYKLDRILESWENIPAKVSGVETAVKIPETPTPERVKSPTPPAPRVSSEPKPSDSSFEKVVTPTDGEVKEETPVKPDENQKEPTRPVMEENAQEAEVPAPQKVPEETNKSAKRLEALLKI